MIHKLSAALAALTCLGTATIRAQLVEGFNDIGVWAGEGANESALVLQWNDGDTPSSLAWGYRWDGVVSGIDMLLAIAGKTFIREPDGGPVIEVLSGADPALEVTVERYGWGDAVFAIVHHGAGQTRTRADWDSGYWEYSLFGGEVDYFTWNGTNFDGPFTYAASGSPLYSQVVWWPSQVGAADRLLVNGSWDAWSFAPGFVGTPVSQPFAAPVPEPRVVGLLGLASLLIFSRFKLSRRGQ